MQKYDTQVLIISDQMIASVTPAIDEAMRPKRVVLCSSNKMLDKCKGLIAFFKDKGIGAEVYSLGDAFDFNELKDKFLELAATFDDPTTVAVNLTGGTKLMTIAAQVVFMDDFACFYVIPQRDLVVMLNSEDKTLYDIQDRINIRDFFTIHGYRVTSMKKSLAIDSKSRELFTSIFKDYDRYVKILGQLNYLAAEAEDRNTLKIRNDINEKAWVLLQLFMQQGSISYYDDKVVEFSSEDARDFCKGIWFEDYTYLALKQLDNEIDLQDFACSVEIVSSSGTKNEIDAAFLYNNNLYIIECKTARMDHKGTNVLYKIDTLKGYTGLFTKSIVATFKPLTKYDHRRADDLNIKLIEGNQLSRLTENILEVIEDRRPN